MARGRVLEHCPPAGAATTGTTWWCCTRECAGGAPAEPQVHRAVDRLAVPRPFCEGVAAPADRHRTSRQRGCHNNQGVTCHPCRPLIHAGSPTLPPLRTQPNPPSLHHRMTDTSGSRVTICLLYTSDAAD